ncbi:unnamed protein product, partial [Ectocarpus fasciculatus]
MAAVPPADLPAVPRCHRRAHLLGPACRQQQGKRAGREHARVVAKALLAARPSWEIAQQQRPLLQRRCSKNKWR